MVPGERYLARCNYFVIRTATVAINAASSTAFHCNEIVGYLFSVGRMGVATKWVGVIERHDFPQLPVPVGHGKSGNWCFIFCSSHVFSASADSFIE